MPDSDIDSCKVCGAVGVKLWRDYGVFSPSLLCGRHVLHASNLPLDIMAEDGTIEGGLIYDFYEEGRRTPLINWWVPAVPLPPDDVVGKGWWGVTSCPPEDFKKWQALPNEMQESDEVIVVE